MRSLRQSYKNSWEFLKASVNFMFDNKGLLVFPVLSLLLSVVCILVGLYSSKVVQVTNAGLLAGCCIWLACVFMLYFFIIFLNTSLIACISQRMQGREMSVGKSLKFSLTRLPQILGWTLISAALNSVFNLLESSDNLFEKIIGLLLSFSWTMASYFVIPVMVNENIGPIKAVKLSAKLIAKSWRRTFGVNSLLALPLLVLLLVLYLLGVHAQYSAKGVIIYLLVVVGYFILLMPFMSALNGIISTAIYLNNIKEVKLNGFDREVLSNALEPRQSKYF